jgi:predicted aminopeptidase
MGDRHATAYRTFRMAGLCAAAVALCLSLGGCRLGYIMHAAMGQARLLCGSEPLAKVEARGLLDKTQLQRAQLIQEVRDFAETDLGLKKTDNYSTIYPKPLKNPIWNISAAPKDKLKPVTWWFPIVGNLPYLGYFDHDRAEAERLKLEKEGNDVVLRRVAAYSTLGWFSDPITMNMLKWQPTLLVEIIIHELTHATLYVKGQSAFNEGLAQFIGVEGAVLFLNKTQGPDSPDARLAAGVAHDERIFSHFLDGLYSRLEKLYNSSVSFDEKLVKREEIYDLEVARFQVLAKQFQTTEFKNFGSNPINNALLISYGLYHRNFDLFRRVYEHKDKSIKKMLDFFIQLSKENHADLLEATRSWLKEQTGEKRAALAIRRTSWNNDKTAVWKMAMSAVPETGAGH